MRHAASGKEKLISGGVKQTTNNRMELTAVIEGLKALKRRCRVKVVSDSAYVVHGMTQWLAQWVKRGWRTAGKKPVKNADLWRELKELASRHDVRFELIAGHTGHTENERCDRAAVEAYQKFLE